MINFTVTNAKYSAAIQLAQRFEKEEAKSDVNYVVVGIDNDHQPCSVYVKPLPIDEEMITSMKMASDIFTQCCKPDKEFLFRFEYDKPTGSIDVKTLSKPNQLLILMINECK